MDREKRSLLIIDNSATYSFYMAMLLKKLDYSVRTASMAEEALRTLIPPLPSLVILDIALPGRSGIDMLKHMAQDPHMKSVPVIIHTAEINPAVKEQCAAAQCVAFFKKPAEPDALYKAIQAATETVPRQNIRIDVSLHAEVGDSALPGGAVRTESVTTLSEGGLYIKTMTPEPVNAAVPLKLFVHDRTIKATAMVLYSSTKIGGPHKVPGMGMRFTMISPEDKNFLHAFIQEQVTKGLSIPTPPRTP